MKRNLIATAMSIALLLSLAIAVRPSYAAPSGPQPTVAPANPEATATADGSEASGLEIASQDALPAKPAAGADGAANPNFVPSSALHTGRVTFNPYRGYGVGRINDWRVLSTSKIFISVSELNGGQRIIGAAPIRVESVAPHFGYFNLSVRVDWGAPLPFQVDYMIVNG